MPYPILDGVYEGRTAPSTYVMDVIRGSFIMTSAIREYRNCPFPHILSSTGYVILCHFSTMIFS